MPKEAHAVHIIQDHLQTALNTSKNVGYSSFLGNLCQCFVTLTVNKYFLMLRRNLPYMFQFVPSSPSPVAGCHWKQLFSLAFTPSLQTPVHLENTYP